MKRGSIRFGAESFRRSRRQEQQGLTLLETMLAMVVTSMVLLPTMGFVTLTMGEQATARMLTTETSNLAAVDLAMVRDVTNAKAVGASVDAAGFPQSVNDCPEGPGAGGAVVLGLISSQNHRIVYSLVQAAGTVGGTLWRRECPNQNFAVGTPLSDPLLQIDPPVAADTEGAIIAQRIKSAASSCPKGDGSQAVDCRQVTLRLQSMTRSTGSEREAVVFQATRRNDTYAVPSTPPIARFSYRPASVEDLDKVVFDARPSRDPRGGTLTYKWSFGPPVGTAVPPEGGFSEPDEWMTEQTIPQREADGTLPAMEVTLTVKSSESGLTDSTTQTVAIDAKGPSAELSPVPPVVVNRRTPLEFRPVLKTYSGATIQQTTWEWGDGTDDQEVCNPGGTLCDEPKTHEFPDTGYVNVKVTVVDTNNKRAEAIVTVKVEPDIVYVSKNKGNDSQPGGCGLAITIPCKSITKGLERADGLVKPRVYVAGGLYDSFEMKSDIELAGGYTEQFDGAGLPSEIVGGTLIDDPTGIVVSNVDNASVRQFKVRTAVVPSGSTQGVLINQSGRDGKVTLQDVEVGYDPLGPEDFRGSGNEPAAILVSDSTVDLLDVTASSPIAVGAGSSAYGMRAIEGSNVAVDGGKYVASRGVDGAPASRVDGPKRPDPPTDGGEGSPGGDNGTGYEGGGNGGAGGYYRAFTCGTWAGSGSNGEDGTSTIGGAGGAGGQPGCFYNAKGGARGERSSGIASGGTGGPGGSNEPISAAAAWQGQAGTSGTDGELGAAGGGGGGGGGNGQFGSAAGGGAGGGRGRPGKAGEEGGGYGGGSFGIYVHASKLSLSAAEAHADRGGNGGYGRDGGAGGNGGKGGKGGDDRTNKEGGGGGAGGNGGGGGGGAGGGEGGPSIAIFMLQPAVGSSANPSSATFDQGGIGGPGGAGGLASTGGFGGMGDDDDIQGGDDKGGLAPNGLGGNGGSQGLKGDDGLAKGVKEQ